MNPVKTTVGVNLQRLRKMRGLTQEALAEQSGVSRAYIARIEAGRHDPRASILAKLGAAMKVNPGIFFGASDLTNAEALGVVLRVLDATQPKRRRKGKGK
jgi:transcriptional regulator with XRE-family HTH domain